MNPNFLHCWNIHNLAIAAPLKSTGNTEGCLTIMSDQEFVNVHDAKRYLVSINPLILECASDKEIEKFAKNPKYNLAKSCELSKLYTGDNVVLIGDAAHPFKPIGQGINIAMLDGMNLDLALNNFYKDDRAKALEYFNKITLIEGNACINLANKLMSKSGRIKEFLKMEYGLQE